MFDLPTYDNPAPVDTSKLPPGQPYAQRGVFTAGLKSGGYGLLAAGAGALSGAAKIVGADDTSAALGRAAARYTNDATTVGRPDIDKAGWTGNGIGGFFNKLGYSAGEMVPGLAAAVGGGVGLTAAAPALGLSGLAAGAGALLPEVLGGGEAAIASGAAARTATAIGGAALAQIPQSFGEQVNAAAGQPGGLTRGGAARALVQAVPVGLAQSIVPAEGAGARLLGGLAGRFGEGALSRFAEHGITNAAAGAIGSGLQTAADDSFNPNLSAGERAANIVGAAEQGAVGGGLFGGLMGAARGRATPEQTMAQVDSALSGAGFDPQNPSGAPSPAQATPAPEPVQQELPLSAPASAAAPGTQFGLFDAPKAYDPGTAPLSDAGTPGAAPEAVPAAPALSDVLATPEPPPPNAFIKDQLAAAKIRVGKGSDFGKFVANSTATNDAELYNELRDVPSDSAIARDPKFIKAVNNLDLDASDLPERLARAQADPNTPPAEIARLQYVADLKVRADALREQQAAPAAAPEPQPRLPGLIQPVEAPADIPELSPVDALASPAVPTDTDAPRASEAASPAIQTAGPVSTTPPEPTPTAVDGSPKSIAEKVLDVARGAAGPGGGDVDVAQIRAALPDVAPKDIDNALRDIHADDSDHTLVQNPKGQRTGVDGVTVPGQGRFHKLEVAPAEGADAVQVGGAAAQAVGDQSQGGGGVREGDAAGGQVARAGETLGAEAGSSGEAQSADQGAAQTAVDPAKAIATTAKLAPRDPNVKSPEQAAQTAAKNAATANILAAPEAAKAVSKPVVTSLRKQARAKTALVESPQGDQIPTEAVGGTTADIPQALAASVDPIQPAGPAEPIAKTPFGRVAGIADVAPVVPRDQLDAHVAKFVAKLRPDVQGKIHILDSGDQHDPTLRDAAARSGLDLSTTSAIYHDGQVFIHADQMRSLGEVEDTLSHEVFGHLATAERFAGASDYQTAMSKIFDRVGGAEGIERIARQRGIWDVNDAGQNLQGAIGLKSYLPPVDTDQMRARTVQGGAALRDYAAVDPSLLTPLYKTRIMDELIAHSAGTTPSPFDRGVQAIQDLARKAIVNTLRRAGMSNFARRLDTFTQADLSKWVADSRKALTQQPRPGDIDLLAGASDPRMFVHDVEPTGEPPFLARVSGKQRDTQGVQGLAGSMLDHIRSNIVYKELFGPTLANPERATAADRARAVRNAFLEQVAPANGIAEEGAIHGMQGLLDHYHTASGPRTVIETRLKQVSEPISQAQFDLKAQAPEKERDLARLMAESRAKKLDPELSFGQHTWLARDNPPERVEALKADHARLVQEFQKLGQPAKGGVKTSAQQIYRDQRAAGNFQWYMSGAQALHNDLVNVHGVDPGYSPAHRYAGMEEGSDPKAAELLHGDVNTSLAFAQKAYQDMMAAAEAHLTDTGTLPENAGTKPYVDLKDTIDQNKLAEQRLVKEGPYFRIGRRGEYTVSGKIKGALDADGEQTNTPDPAALKAIQAVVNEKFPQVSFGLSDANRSFFSRFENQSVANDFGNLFAEGGPLRQHIDQEHGTRVALMSDTNHGLAEAIPALQAHIDQAAALYDADLARLGSGPSYDALKEARDNYIGNLRASLINLRGDNSMSSLLSRFEGVQGASSDMARNQQEAAASYARDIAFTATRNDLADGLAQARDAIAQVQRSQAKDALPQAARMQRIYDAYDSRDVASNKRVDNTFLSWTKRFMHPFQLAMSPAYVLMNGSQLATLTAPELAKFHGFARSNAAMAKALIPAGKVIASMVSQKGIFEGGITKAVLDHANIGNLRDFTSTMSNQGHLEMGSFTANQSGLSFGSMGRVQKFLHFANSTALLAETFTRLIAAYAAKDLHENLADGPARQSMLRQFPSSADYAGHVVQETMMGWGNANTPKFMTAGGVLGPAGPAIFQFHGWTPRLLEKLYRESANGYTQRLGEGGNADTARAEARTFVKAHLTMVGLISGGLGLPFLSTALGAGTRLSGLVSDQPIDMEAGLRDFLASTFGKDVGEVLARGVPRYLGTDMAELGDNNFVPFSRIIENRAKLEDAIPDYAAHAWGSSVGMATNALLAVREMSEGRFSEAGARALPTALRNLVRGYRVAEYGHINAQGEQLPVPSGPAEIAKTVLGMEGGQLAEERERQDSLRGLKDDRQYRTSVIKKNLVLAVARGDSNGVAEAMAAARKYDQDNPGEHFSAQLPGLLQNQQRIAATARLTNTLGLRPGDLVASHLTNY